jgi:hypothetical protein
MATQNQNQNESQNDTSNEPCYCYSPICRRNPVKIKCQEQAVVVGGLWNTLKNTTTDRSIFNDFKKNFGFLKSKTEVFSNQEVESIIEVRKMPRYQQYLFMAMESGDAWKNEMETQATLEECSICEGSLSSIDNIHSTGCCKNYNKHIKDLLELLEEWDVLEKGEKKRLLRDLKANKSCRNVLKWILHYSRKDAIKTFDMTRELSNQIAILIGRSKNPNELECIKKCLVKSMNIVSLGRDNCFDYYWKDIIKDLKVNNMDKQKRR